MKHFDISIVIPSYNDSDNLKEVLNSLISQQLLPQKIIIIDSSDNDKIASLIKNYKNFKNLIFYKKINRAYAGKSINYGVKLSDSEYVGFIDTKTVPNINWLLNYKNEITNNKIDVIFGVTEFKSKTYFQKLIRAASYGLIGHESVPGTIIKRNSFLKIGGFYEYLRAAYDIEWRLRAKKRLKYITPKYSTIVYSSLPKNIFEAYNKYIVYSFHSAIVDVQLYIKSTYLSLFFILSAITIPKWNFLIGNWERNPLYIPYITRIYLLVLLIILFFNLFINNYINKNSIDSIFKKTLKLLVFIFVSLGVYNWNEKISHWIINTVWYIPHITKIYICLIIIGSLFYRGIFFPLKRKISKEFLFPFNFLNVGLLGLSLDLIKAPGYLIGSIIAFFKYFNFKKN